jgi:REP element-mobilizing transposase RayT
VHLSFAANALSTGAMVRPDPSMLISLASTQYLPHADLVMASRGQLSLFPRPRPRRRRGPKVSDGSGPRPRARRRRGPEARVGSVPHRKRPPLVGRYPVHVTVRLRDGLPNLRRRDLYAMLRGAFRLGRDRFHFRLAHFSVQHHHVHLLCEAPTAAALGRGMQGLTIRIARGVNRLRGVGGSVFHERYHAHELRTLTETRNAMRYLVHNDLHHGNVGVDFAGRVDPCTSLYFWTHPRRLFAGENAPVTAPRSDHLRAALRLDFGVKGPPPDSNAIAR